MTSVPPTASSLAMAFWLVVGLGVGWAESEISEELIRAEMELALQAALAKSSELERQLATIEEERIPMEVSLAAANAEADSFRQKYRDLLLKVESWGLESIQSGDALRERLVVAVREREEARNRARQSQEQLLALSEVVTRFMTSAESKDPKARLDLEAELRRSEERLGFGSRRVAHFDTAKALEEGMVVSVKAELDLAVLDVGRESGVKVGMPMYVFRKDRRVGAGVVVDVRDRVCALVGQEILKEGDQIEVGDRVEPMTTERIDF